MQAILPGIKDLFLSFNSEPIVSVEKLPQSGSDRTYFRIYTHTGSYIATHNLNPRETVTFVEFSRHFKQCGVPVPLIYAVNTESTLYIQEDFGDTSLLNKLEEGGESPEVLMLFRQTLQKLAYMQVAGGKTLDYNLCLTAKEFGRQAIMSDLLYFKYYFLDTLKIPYDKQALLDEFEHLGNYLTNTAHNHFMFRDFQSRNIMIRDGQVHFIDFQGGMKGALQYDVASLLWQARADLSDQWKNDLLQYYIDCISEQLDAPVEREVFVNQYYGYVLIRLLQVLGAYGFRGLFERKAHFLTSIPLALKNLKWFILNKQIGLPLPEFDRLLGLIVDDEVVHRFQPVQATPECRLTVKIHSFSFKQNHPVDETANGGGFVFDCRGIYNPGRLEEFRRFTGRDKVVKDFLEQQTRMPDFMNSVYNLVDISVEDYIRRDFSQLMVSFGCTGGQHRSVYAADELARHLRNKFKVKTEIRHLVQDPREWVN